MKLKIQRQLIIDYILKNKGHISGDSYKEVGLEYPQAMYNHLKSLQARGYITRVGNKTYSVIKEIYKHEMVVEEIKKELTRLRKIEKKYNAICSIINNSSQGV